MRFLRLVFPILVVGVFGAGCKQGLGDRCQVDTDCAEPAWECSADKVCRITGGSVVFDGGAADASIDAALDNPVDAPLATVDAPPAATVDASTTDAP